MGKPPFTSPKRFPARKCAEAMFAVGDLAQWISPLCVVRIRYADQYGYVIEAIPGINGTPLDVKNGARYSLGFHSLEKIPVEALASYHLKAAALVPTSDGETGPLQPQKESGK